MDLDRAILYRLAFALAAELAEALSHRLAGRFHANPAAGGTLEQVVAEVVRRHAVGAESVGLVREAVEDALERRRPRW